MRRPTEVLGEASETIDRVLLVLVARLAEMTGASVAWPAGSDDGGGGHSAKSDPTFAAATAKDRSWGHRREVERLIRSIDAESRRLEQLVSLYEPRPATAQERQDTLRDNEREEGCSSCRRTAVAKGVQRWEPVHKDSLCRWCYDWRRSTGSLPLPAELDRHHRGQRVARPA